jgi:TPR repeat protein
MKNTVVAVFGGLLLLAAFLALSFSGGREHDPKDLPYWMRAGAAKDWSLQAAHGEPQAQFHVGLILIRTNLVTLIDRVPGLSAVPLIGKPFFERISYGIDKQISQEQLEDAYRWIKKSADQGFAPAKEVEKLFIGRVGRPNQGGATGAAKGSQPVGSETDSPSSAAGSPR